MHRVSRPGARGGGLVVSVWGRRMGLDCGGGNEVVCWRMSLSDVVCRWSRRIRGRRENVSVLVPRRDALAPCAEVSVESRNRRRDAAMSRVTHSARPPSTPNAARSPSAGQATFPSITGTSCLFRSSLRRHVFGHALAFRLSSCRPGHWTWPGEDGRLVGQTRGKRRVQLQRGAWPVQGCSRCASCGGRASSGDPPESIEQVIGAVGRWW